MRYSYSEGVEDLIFFWDSGLGRPVPSLVRFKIVMLSCPRKGAGNLISGLNPQCCSS